MVFLPNYYVCKVCGKSYSRSCKLQSHMNFHSEENHVKGASLSQVPDRFDLGCHGYKKSLDSSVCDNGFTRKDHVAKNTLNFHRNEETKKTSTESTQKSEVLRKRSVSRSVRVTTAQAKKDDRGKIHYECEVCKQRLTQLSSLRSHMRKHTGERPFKCKDCKKSFTFYQCLWNHARKHTGEKNFECKVCLKRFVYYQSLWNHNKIHTGEKPHECKVCGKKYGYMYCLKIHSRRHTGERPYKCTVCNKRFMQHASLKVHYKIHSKERPLECNVCKKRFRNILSLSKHGKQHTKQNSKDLNMMKKNVSSFPKMKRESARLKNEKHHHNSVCQGGVMNTKSHTNPTKTHKKEKSSRCHVCGKNLASCARLKIHSRIHTGEKPYKCSLCPKAFIDNCGFWKHKKVHEGEKSCQRKVCEKHFVHSHSLKSHAKYQSADLHQRKKSSKMFQSSCNLKSHARSHSSEDVHHEKSSKLFQSYTLDNHSITLRDTKSYECKVCNKKFACSSYLKRHVMKHSDIKPYGCEDCNKRFKLKGWLIRHCKLVHKNWYEKSISMEYACKHCKSVFFSVDDVTNHQKCIMCKICDELFYCSYMFCYHTSTCSRQNVFSQEALVRKDAESPKNVFRAIHSKNDLDEFEKNLLEGSVVYPYSSQNPVERGSFELSEKRDVLRDNYINTYACDAQDSSGSQVYHHPVSGVSFCNYDYLTYEKLWKWAGYHNQMNKAGTLDGSVQESGYGYFLDNTYSTANNVCVSPVLCDICGETFVSEAVYTYHRMQHFVAREGHQCPTCGEMVSNEIDLTAHALGHMAIL